MNNLKNKTIKRNNKDKMNEKKKENKSDDEEEDLVSHGIIALNSSVSNNRSSKVKTRPSVLTSKNSKQEMNSRKSPTLEVKQVRIQEMKINCEDSPTRSKALGQSLLPKK